jgi:hypothetical protein
MWQVAHLSQCGGGGGFDLWFRGDHRGLPIGSAGGVRLIEGAPLITDGDVFPSGSMHLAVAEMQWVDW